MKNLKQFFIKYIVSIISFDISGVLLGIYECLDYSIIRSMKIDLDGMSLAAFL